MNMMRKQILLFISIIVIAGIAYRFDSPSLLAQTPIIWSPRTRIPGTHDKALTPYLVADQNRTVHAFFSQPLDDDDEKWAIFYNQWRLDEGWTTPNDIFLGLDGDAIYVHGAFLDKAGTMHMIFYCCNDLTPNIYYTHAPVMLANQAPAWSSPLLVGSVARQPHSAALASDNQGNFYVVYSGEVEGKGIYAVHSADSGNSWSSPVPLFFTYDEKLLPFNVKLYLDQQGQLHATWTVNRADGNGNAIYYARLAADHVTWSEAIPLETPADGRFGAITSQAIFGWGEELLVVYLGWADFPVRMARRSTDSGKSWSEPFEFLPPTRGEYGSAVFADDSDQQVHVVFGDRGRDLTLWHSSGRNGNWLPPDAMVPPSEAAAYPQGHPLEFHPVDPEIVISQGNVLLATWVLDPGHGDNGIWYTFANLGTPELPLVPLPTLFPTRTPIPTATAITVQQPVTPTVMGIAPSPKEVAIASVNSPARLLLVGVSPVLLMVIVIIVIRQINHYRG